MANRISNALLAALAEDRHVDDPLCNAPWSPPSILADEARINANLEAARELEGHLRAIRDLQSPDFNSPGRQNSLPSSMQVAAIPGRLSALFSAPPDLMSMLASVPLEQARSFIARALPASRHLGD